MTPMADQAAARLHRPGSWGGGEFGAVRSEGFELARTLCSVPTPSLLTFPHFYSFSPPILSLNADMFALANSEFAPD